MVGAHDVVRARGRAKREAGKHREDQGPRHCGCGRQGDGRGSLSTRAKRTARGGRESNKWKWCGGKEEEAGAEQRHQ
jgi:hypothetical protein